MLKIYLGAICSMILLGCAAQFADEENPLPTRRQLRSKLRQADTVLMIYGDNPVYRDRFKNSLAEIRPGNWQQPQNWLILSVSEAQEMDLDRYPLFLYGSKESHKILKELVREIPIRQDKGEIKLGKKRYKFDNSVLSVSMYPNPQNKEMPLSILTAGSDSLLISWIEDEVGRNTLGNYNFWGRWGYQIFSGTRKMIVGQFGERESNLWKIDEEMIWDFSDQGVAVQKDETLELIDLTGSSRNDNYEVWLHEFQACRDSILGFFARDINELSPIKVFLYPNSEQKGLGTGSTDFIHLNTSEFEAHIVMDEIFLDQYPAELHTLWLRQLFGGSEILQLEQGLGLHFSDKWQRKGYKYWSHRLYQAELFPDLATLFSEENPFRYSRLISPCMYATAVDFLIEHYGIEDFQKFYESGKYEELKRSSLNKAWKAYLRSNFSTLQEVEAIPQTLAYLNGFNLAHEGYDIYNGYISEKAEDALGLLKDISGNAAAIVPYSFMRDPNSPNPLSIPNNPRSENDESVIYAANAAQKLGMEVMLKPQIWLGRSWPGDVEMKNNKDWEAFFYYYKAWIAHYALMAEIYGMEFLCVGVEFAKATLVREKDWREVIKMTRSIYSGKITYAANWGPEFENLKFWDALDYIGLNCYYPLSKELEVSDEELRDSFEKVLDNAEKVTSEYKKPLLFTEIGFRCIDAPWQQPHAEPGDKAPNMGHQARSYQVVFEALEDEEWQHGIFWWKWPSYLEYGRGDIRRYSPVNKPAQDVVQEWFSKKL